MNQSLFASLYDLSGKSAFLDGIFILFAGYWEYAVVISFIIYLLYSRRKDSPALVRSNKQKAAQNAAWAVVSAVIARLFIVNIIRFFYVTDRPFVFEEFTPLLDHAANNSFPSGHAAFFMAIAVYFLLVKEKKFGWFLFASAVLISLARVMVGIHWPADILVGWVIGGLVAWIIWYLVKTSKEKNPPSRQAGSPEALVK